MFICQTRINQKNIMILLIFSTRTASNDDLFSQRYQACILLLGEMCQVKAQFPL